MMQLTWLRLADPCACVQPACMPPSHPLSRAFPCCCTLQGLFESGMLDGSEQAMLATPIDEAERRLELLGPVWKAPSLAEVLRQLPFMRGHSQAVIDFFLK